MKIHALLLSLALVAVTTAAPAKVYCAQVYPTPVDNGPISRFGAMNSQVQDRLPELFRLLVWNVKKNEIKGMVEDYRQISQDAHLVLLQEMIDQPQLMVDMTLAKPDLTWTMARAFFWKSTQSYTGVATGSTARPIRMEPYLSPVAEPIAKTPKSVMLSEYEIGNSGARLMVVNIHAINFVSQSSFAAHIDQVVSLIRDHVGPLVVAGDFNTWTDPRLIYLERAMNKLGLKNLDLGKAGWLNAFDHVFARGLRVEQSIGLDRIATSDHKPLLVDLVYDPHAVPPLP